MPIELSCSCGRALNLRDELAGKVIRCPECAGTLQVPLPVVEVVEEIEEIEEIAAGPPPLRADRSDGVAAGPPPLSQKKAAEIELAPPVLTPKRPKEPREKKKKKKSVYQQFYGKDQKTDPIVSLDEGWFGSMNAGLLGGALTLLVGILLLVIFLSLGLRFRGLIFAIVLIVAGLGAMLKGLMDLY